MHPKVATTLGASGGTAPLVVIVLWLLGPGWLHLDLPPEVAGAFASLITTGVGFLAGYLTPSP